MFNTPDSSISTPVRQTQPAIASHEDEVYRIADNTLDASVEDLHAIATPRKKRFPVNRLPTSNKNTPKRFIPLQSPRAAQDDSPDSLLSEPEISLPSLPSISQLCSGCYGSQENLFDVSMDDISAISPTPMRVRRMPEAESMTIEEILQCSTLDNVGLLDLDLKLNVSESTDDLFWE